MSKLSGAMWHHIPSPSARPGWIPVDTHVSEGNLYIKSLSSLSTQSIWRKIRSDSQPNKYRFLTFKPNGKAFLVQEISADKTQLLQRHTDLIFHFPNSKKFKKSSSSLPTEHKTGNCPVLLGICKASQLLFTTLRFTYVGSKFKNASLPNLSHVTTVLLLLPENYVQRAIKSAS